MPQDTVVLNACGIKTLITPPYAHMQIDDSVSAGWLAIMVVIAPGIHGAVVAGVQVPGVSTPSAADVCAAVIGLVSDVHNPNGAMLSIGLLSMMLATGIPSTITRFSGSTFNVDGMSPNEHCNVAPDTTGRDTRTR